MNGKSNRIDKRFLVLGNPKQINQYISEKKLKKVIRRNQRSKLSGVWGTLGWRNNKTFEIEVQHSKTGNQDKNKRDQSTNTLITDLKSFNKKIRTIKNDVLERYINFNTSEFEIDWSQIKRFDEIPQLRLDLFVEDEQGAMVYFYHQLKENFGQKRDKDVFEEFIQCQKTDDEYTTKRDRLSYFFRVLPPNKFTVNEDGTLKWSNETRETSFILKIITFKRKSGTNESLLKNFFNNDNLDLVLATKGQSVTYNLFGEKKNGLLIYDGSVENSDVAVSNKDRFTMRGAFFNVDDDHPVDRTKKTLLLIHGTFSSTLNTFEGLVKYQNGGTSELEKFLEATEYEQVIAFNHPTISADVFKNIEVLKERLGTEKFSKTVGMISASRGCILSQAIGADKDLPFRVDKALLFSPANGVAYFDKLGDHISTGLSILKKVTKGRPASYIFALLQFSADYFMKQPGCMQMRFENEKLTKVLAAKLEDQNSKYVAIVNDWNKKLVDKKVKRFGMKIADGVIKLILGKEHDFVVGVEGQTNLPPEYNVKQVKMSSTHCKYFTKGELHKRDSAEEVVLSEFLIEQFVEDNE